MVVVDSECPYCGDTLHGFIEELEDGTEVLVKVCPTCYRYHHVDTQVPS